MTGSNPLRPVHPGEILLEEFMRPLDMTPYGLARVLRVSRPRLERLVREEVPMSADTAVRLSRYFGNSAEFWMGIQARYDIELATAALAEKIGEITPREAA